MDFYFNLGMAGELQRGGLDLLALPERDCGPANESGGRVFDFGPICIRGLGITVGENRLHHLI